MVSIFKMNKTKHKIQFPASFIAAFSFFFILTCSEDPGHGPHGSDGIPPGKVTINQVVNTPGGAIIYFSPPSDEDLLYVRASFEDENENPLTCVVYHVYRIHHFPIIREITRSQFVIAFLAQTINFHFKKKGEKKQLHFQAYYKIPSCKKINKHIKKLRCKLKKQFVYNN